jgi:hypothetical protein
VVLQEVETEEIEITEDLQEIKKIINKILEDSF